MLLILSKLLCFVVALQDLDVEKCSNIPGETMITVLCQTFVGKSVGISVLCQRLGLIGSVVMGLIQVEPSFGLV